MNKLHIKILLIASAVVMTFSGCKKEKLSPEITVTVVELPSGRPLPNIAVHLESNIYDENGESFVTNREMTADVKGQIKFSRNEGHEFVHADVDGYFTGSRFRKTVVDKEFVELELTGQAWLRVNFVNIPEAEAADQAWVWTRFLNDSPMPDLFEGADVNEELFGLIRANEEWHIRWREIQYDEVKWHSLYAVAAVGDTLDVSVAY